MKNLKIGQRMALGFGLVIAMLAVAMLTIHARLETAQEHTARVASAQQLARDARAWHALTHLNVTRAIVLVKAPDNQSLAATLTPKMKAASERINGYQKDLIERVQEGEGKALIGAVGERRESYLALRKKLLALLKEKEGVARSAQEDLEAQMLAAADAYVASIEAFADFEERQAAASSAQVLDDIEGQQQLALALLAASALLSVLAGWLLTRSITVPLMRMVGLTERVAAGDLSETQVVEGRDEVSRMQAAMQAMQQALCGILGEIRASSDSVAIASTQIASGNQDLSSRTEQTAGNLQQTASGLEQLTATVAHTAESAQAADALAQTARGAASQGGLVVARVRETMEAITQSSRQIGSIIGTIDGIAFQTNILALNAAVEAARAGEQGRGFSVVASEVRSLAQRSAGAAREIKALIESSVERIEAGAGLVVEAQRSMEEISGSVGRVTEVISGISAASAEQSRGLSSIHGAISELDRMTQQNAALVEESAAAAHAMAEQSGRLTQVIARFRLPV
ncbi:MAG TPA: methyl-accepting chemotaxis protein [Burkholderiaceae bacterium]|nr:methyl-accepting chemotaxis protein [Burkholderiaceae bacterium]